MPKTGPKTAPPGAEVASTIDNEELLRVTLESIGDAVITTDARANVTRLNPVAEALTGWRTADAVGRPIHQVFRIINQHTRAAGVIPVMETLAKGTIQGLANHTVLIARDGTECAIADSCAPIRTAAGDVIGAILVFRDVSEEHAAQAALRDSAAQIHAVMNAIADGVITFRAESATITTTNPAAERQFGYSAAEFVGMDFRSLVPELAGAPPSLDAYSPNEAERALGLGHEATGLRRDGTQFSLELSVSEMTLGGQRYFNTIVRDSTRRRATEEALRKEGALQRAIFTSANFSSIATDARGVIQIFNVGAERMLGYTAAEVMDTITPADISDADEVIARAKALSAELGTPINPGFEALVFKASRGIEDIYELTYIRKDGTRFPAIVSVTALRDGDDTIIGYLLIGTDNTARKQVEAEQLKLDQRLRDQHFYTRSLIESNIDALITTDPAGIITDVNRQMESLTGCTRDELIGAPFKACFTDPDRADAGIRQVLREKKVTDYELVAVSRTGAETAVSYNATTFFDRDRRLQGVFAAARDISERKRLDQVLQDKNTELEAARFTADKANLAKSDFLSSMSHELRSPLNAILGFAQLMDSDIPPASPAQKASIGQILHAGWYLLELINEILDLAVVESGKVSLSVEPVSLAEVMIECQAMIAPLGHARGLTLVFPDFAIPQFVTADRTRLKQVLINLLSNAIKYNRTGGRVIVECVQVGATRTRVYVRDTGLGLSAEKMPLLFQPFNRLGQETSAEEGTGIGLVMSKLLVELMGGTIGAESTIGVGSVFWFELVSDLPPAVLADAMPTQFSTDARATGGPRPRTVLYVEDNVANLKLVEQLLARRPNVRLLTAGTGTLGVEIARRERPELVLMDINLPGISGVQALKLLLADPLTANIPVLAISANAMLGDIRRGLEAGFTGYLTKPINVGEFMEAVDNALDAPKPPTDTAKPRGPRP